MGLQSTPFTLTKVIQLYETKNSRHSTMIVGCTGSGKTTSWRILQASLSSLCRAGEPNFSMVRVRTGDGDAPAGDRGTGGRGQPGGRGLAQGHPGETRDREQVRTAGNRADLGVSQDLCVPFRSSP